MEEKQMSTEHNKELCRRLYAAVSTGDFDALDQLIAPNFIEHEMVDPGMPAGREGMKTLFRMVRQAMPDMVMTVEDMVAEGERVAVRAVMSGTQTGEFMGIPASGKRVAMTVMDLHRIENNQFTEHWGVSDMLGLMTQIGAIPAPGTP
jgi:steroid delta-isomerase-like uncharacterized protein